MTPNDWVELTSRFEVDANETEENWDERTFVQAVRGKAGVLTSWGSPPFTDPVWASADRLRLIVHMAGSVKFLFPGDVVDRFCRPRGITVVSCARAIAFNVAEATLGLMIWALRGWLDHVLAFRQKGLWRDPRLAAVPKTLSGGVVGIIGAGFVGQEVIRLLRSFRDVQILLYDPFVSEEEAMNLGASKVDLETLLSESDLVSLHAPWLPSTEGMIGARELALLKDGCVLINTSRGRLVDTDALVSVLRSGRIFAVLDVTDPEPLPPDHPLRFLPNCIILPHITGAGEYGYRQIGKMTLRALDDFFLNNKVPEGVIDWSRYGLIA